MLGNKDFRLSCSQKATNVAEQLDADVILKEWLNVIGEVYEF